MEVFVIVVATAGWSQVSPDSRSRLGRSPEHELPRQVNFRTTHMSEAATTVRPKPRPKPLPKATSSTVFAHTSAPGTSSSANKVTYDNVKDSDEMFMRNRGRGKDGWAKLRKISKGELSG